MSKAHSDSLTYNTKLRCEVDLIEDLIDEGEIQAAEVLIYFAPTEATFGINAVARRPSVAKRVKRQPFLAVLGRVAEVSAH